MDAGVDQNQAPPANDAGAGAGSWAAAAEPSATPAPGGPSPAAATLAAAKNPDRSAIDTTSPDVTAQVGGQAPLVLRPTHQGLRGIIDKVADVLAGTTHPDTYQDEQGNTYVYHPQMSRGQQWMKIGGELIHGAAAGLAAGRGRGPGAAGLAGFEAGQQDRDREQQQEQQMTQEARQAMMDKANAQMLRMHLAEQTWRLSRLQPDTDNANAQASIKTGEGYRAQGGTMIGTMLHPGELANVTKTNPDIASDLVKKGVINIVPHYEQGEKGDYKLAGLEVWKMPEGWRKEMLPSGSTFDWFNPQTGKIEQHTASDPMTAGEQADYHASAVASLMKFNGDKAEQEHKAAETKNLNSEATDRDAMLPLKKQQTRSEIAKNNAEARKAKVEADAAEGNPEKDDIEAQALALVEHRSAPSLQNKRSKVYNAIMNRADQISIQKFGHPLDQTEAEQAYQARTKLIKDYTDGQAADSIESFDRFLGHALEASQAVNGLRNTDAKLLNTPINKLSSLTGGQRSGALQNFLIKADTVRKEFETTLKNNHALTVEDIKLGERLLDENLSPAQMQESMRGMAHVAAVRLRGTDFKYARTMGRHVPDLISDQGKESLQHFGVDPQTVYSSPQQQQGQQRPSGPPPGAAGTQQFTDNKLHYVDANGKDLGVAQ